MTSVGTCLTLLLSPPHQPVRVAGCVCAPFCIYYLQHRTPVFAWFMRSCALPTCSHALAAHFPPLVCILRHWLHETHNSVNTYRGFIGRRHGIVLVEVDSPLSDTFVVYARASDIFNFVISVFCNNAKLVDITWD